MRHFAGDDYYSDLFVFGPPGALWLNELFLILFGSTEVSIYIIGCIFSIITLVGVYQCATLLGNRSAGILSSLIWTAISLDILTQANQPNTEAYVNACLLYTSRCV